MFFNEMKNGNTLTKRIIKKQPRVTTVAVPQKNSFGKIKHKLRAKIFAQAQIQILSLPVSGVVIENEKKSPS